MSDFVVRLQEEKTDLNHRRMKLEKFINSPAFNDIEDKEKELLIEQLEVMKRYYGILNHRCYRHSTGVWADEHPFNERDMAQ